MLMKRCYLFILSCLAFSAADAQLLAPRPARAQQQVRDTLVFSAYDCSRNGVTTMSSSADYDKYGLATLMTKYIKDSPDGQPLKHDRYTYEVNPFGVWTHRIVETDYRPEGLEGDPTDGWFVNSVMKREVDAEGRVVAIDATDMPHKYHRTLRYDYEHEYFVPYDTTPRRGFAVEDCVERSSYRSTSSYRWHERAGKYLLVAENNGAFLSQATFFADSVRTEVKNYQSDTGEFAPYQVVTDYYRMDGMSCKGSKTENLSWGGVSGNVTLTGVAGDSTTTISRIYDRQRGWRSTECRVLWGSKEDNFTPYREKVYYYDNEGNPIYNRTEVYEIVGSSPAATFYCYADEDPDGVRSRMRYYVRFAGEDQLQEVERVGDDAFLLTLSQIDHGRICDLYDLSGARRGTYKVMENPATPFGTFMSSSIYSVCAQQADGSWKPLERLNWTDPTSGAVKVCTFNAQGYPETLTLAFSTKPDSPYGEYRYTYGPESYTVEYYYYGRLKTRDTYELLADGWVSDVRHTYDADGAVTRGERTDSWLSCRRHYTWDSATGAFTFDRVEVSDHVYLTDDGTRVTVTCQAQGQTAVPVSKSERFFRSALSILSGRWNTIEDNARYTWDAALQDWVGDTRTRQIFHTHDFLLDYGRRDLIYYNDGDDVLDDTPAPKDPEYLYTSGDSIFEWEAQARGWKFGTLKGTFAALRADGEAEATTYADDGSATNNVYRLGPDGRICEETVTKTDADG